MRGGTSSRRRSTHPSSSTCTCTCTSSTSSSNCCHGASDGILEGVPPRFPVVGACKVKLGVLPVPMLHSEQNLGSPCLGDLQSSNNEEMPTALATLHRVRDGQSLNDMQQMDCKWDAQPIDFRQHDEGQQEEGKSSLPEGL